MVYVILAVQAAYNQFYSHDHNIKYFPSSLEQGYHVLEPMISNSSVVTTSHVMDIINLF